MHMCVSVLHNMIAVYNMMREEDIFPKIAHKLWNIKYGDDFPMLIVGPDHKGKSNIIKRLLGYF